MREAIRNACANFSDLRKEALRKTGVLVPVCVGPLPGGWGRGEWVRDATRAWVCASGAEPVLMLDDRHASKVLTALAAIFARSLAIPGEVIDVKGFGMFSTIKRGSPAFINGHWLTASKWVPYHAGGGRRLELGGWRYATFKPATALQV